MFIESVKIEVVGIVGNPEILTRNVLQKVFYNVKSKTVAVLRDAKENSYQNFEDLFRKIIELNMITNKEFSIELEFSDILFHKDLPDDDIVGIRVVTDCYSCIFFVSQNGIFYEGSEILNIKTVSMVVRNTFEIFI